MRVLIDVMADPLFEGWCCEDFLFEDLFFDEWAMAARTTGDTRE